MNYYIKPINHRSYEYDEYLDNHIANVQRVWNEQFRPYVEEYYPELLDTITKLVGAHDTSKYSDEEHYAYCNYFYPTKMCPKNEAAFDMAWLHHQKNNPHHWQYWLLIRDEGEVVPMDMPVEYIAEMVCDWHSFSYVNPESTAYNWYNNNKDNMMLSENTIKLLEEMLEYLKGSLTE